MADATDHLREIELDCCKVDWDGYGAMPIKKQAVDAARKILELLKSKPHLSPCSSGGILFEWFGESERLCVQVEQEPYLIAVLVSKSDAR